MSTRATYQFRSEYGCDFTIYIHHDGYLKGAATHFAAACRCPNQRGGMAERMLRAVDGAELTESHEAHGDTEFRYTLARPRSGEAGPDVLLAEARSGESWRPVFQGTLAGFLNSYGEDGPKAWTMLGRRCLPVESLEALTKQAVEAARECLSKGWSGNADSYAGDVARYVKAGARMSREELRGFLEEICVSFPHMVEYHLGEAGLS